MQDADTEERDAGDAHGAAYNDKQPPGDTAGQPSPTPHQQQMLEFVQQQLLAADAGGGRGSQCSRRDTKHGT